MSSSFDSTRFEPVGRCPNRFQLRAVGVAPFSRPAGQNREKPSPQVFEISPDPFVARSAAEPFQSRSRWNKLSRQIECSLILRNGLLPVSLLFQERA